MKRKDFLKNSLASSVAFATMDNLSLRNKNPRKDLKPFYIAPDPEPFVAHEGTLIRIKVRTKNTDNQIGCVELSLAPKTMGPPPHVHKELDELMFVQKGEVHVMVGEEVTIVKAGGYHMRPHGIIHCFWNASDEPAHFTDFFCNQNFDDFFEELFFKIIPELKAQNLLLNSPEGMKRRADLDKRFGLTPFPEKRKAIIEKYGLKA